MSEDQNIPGENSKEPITNSNEEIVDENNSQEQVIVSPELQTINSKLQTEEMEVHHHPHHVMHKKKWTEYLLEFFMLFLAVFLGFVAENIRESSVNDEKALHYIQNLVADLKADIVDVSFAIYYNQLWSDHLDSALQVPIDRLKDINSQDTFYYHFLPYYSWVQSFVQNDNTIAQLKAGGFNFIRNEDVVDSINVVYNFYRIASFNNDYNYTCYWDVARKAQELMDMPTPPTTLPEDVPKRMLQNKEVFIEYDIAAIHQLYSMIRNAKGSLATTIDYEKRYREKAEALLTYLQKEYHLK